MDSSSENSNSSSGLAVAAAGVGAYTIGINNSLIEEIETNITTALQNSKYILNLSNDYLDMARIKADHFKLNIMPFDLYDLLEDCIQLFSIQAYKLNTSIVLKRPTKKQIIHPFTTLNTSSTCNMNSINGNDSTGNLVG